MIVHEDHEAHEVRAFIFKNMQFFMLFMIFM